MQIVRETKSDHLLTGLTWEHKASTKMAHRRAANDVSSVFGSVRSFCEAESSDLADAGGGGSGPSCCGATEVIIVYVVNH